MSIYYKNRIIKVTDLLFSTVSTDGGNYNLIGHVSCYGYRWIYNRIIVTSITLSCLIDVQINISN